MCDCEKLEEAREDINHYLNSAWRLNDLLAKACQERDEARRDVERANKLLLESFAERDALRQERDEAREEIRWLRSGAENAEVTDCLQTQRDLLVAKLARRNERIKALCAKMKRQRSALALLEKQKAELQRGAVCVPSGLWQITTTTWEPVTEPEDTQPLHQEIARLKEEVAAMRSSRDSLINRIKNMVDMEGDHK